MTALPSPSRPAPKSRSRHPHDDIQSAPPAMLHSSPSRNPSSASSTATTLPGYSSTPQSPTERPTTPASVTISRTRERLRLAELECDELRRALNGEQARALEMGRIAEEERAIAERLKREGGGMELSTTEAKFRILQLRDDERAASAELPPRPITGLFKAACSTDLLFLIDTTGSMSRHINAAKTQVKSIIKDIRASFLNQADVRMAVVGYKDHSDRPNIQFLDFTSSATRVRWFLGQLTACGGGDPPEDVLGGLRQALNATWMHQTRCIIHIADAPPHGHTLQVSRDMTDTYPEPGSEPHGLTHQPLLKLMLGLNINYALLRINRTTDFMAFTFFEAYAAASGGCKLHKANMFYKRACVLTEDSKHSARAGLLFEEFELGTTFNALQHLVVKMVTTSASRTAVRSSSSTSRIGKVGNKKLDTNLTAIEEDEDVDELQLELISPKWNVHGWFNETLNVEGFSPDVVVHGPSTLNDMMAHDDNIKMSITELSIRKRLRPFAQGALRVASYARTAASTNQFVVKSFKQGGKRLAHLAEGMRCQALCKAFALEFNSLVGENLSIDFIVTTCLKRKSVIPSGDECMSLEPFIEGTYVKYNNNCGYVNEDSPYNEFNKAAQAFSHFTFERSQGSFLVSDLQGVGRLLTDPAIHTLDPERFKLAETNLGKEGFKFFFATHICNDICSKLGLKSKASMVVSGRFKFRERWPSVDDIVCCSNKLCGMIVRLASAHKSDNWPGYHWCSTCWPQLFSFMSKRICVAPGPHHEFIASEFFHESQGQVTPRKCPKHRETVSMSVEIGGNNWDGPKFEKKKKSFFELRR